MPIELAVRRTWDTESNSWAADVVLVRLAREAFSQGAMRLCHRLLVRNGRRGSPWQGPACNWVAKHYGNDPDSSALLEADVRMQQTAKRYSELFNAAARV